MDIIATILMLCLIMQSIDCLPKPANHPASNSKKPIDAGNYLKKFGYMKPGRTESQAIQAFQNFYGLPVTGKVDDATKKLFETPRCGVKDPQEDGGRKRRSFSLRIVNREKRYVKSSYSWKPLFSRIGEKRLRWKLTSIGTQILGADEIFRILREAFAMWASTVDGLIFEEVGGGDDAELIIFFAANSHGDGYSFDGSGGVLAHAFYPYDVDAPLAGDTHFDDDEVYTDKTYVGVNFWLVALHEIGHALGLGHSKNRDAVMYAYYTGYIPGKSLHEDDVNGIRAIYGDGGDGGDGGGKGGKGGCKGKGKKAC